MNNVISICGALASNCKFSIVPGYLSYNYDYDYAVESTWPSSLPSSKGLTRTGNVLEVSGQYIYIFLVPWSYRSKYKTSPTEIFVKWLALLRNNEEKRLLSPRMRRPWNEVTVNRSEDGQKSSFRPIYLDWRSLTVSFYRFKIISLFSIA